MANLPQNTAENGSEDPPASPQVEDFNWLNRGHRGPSYTCFSQYSHLPYCSFEWGNEGFAGSCSHGGELLYLSQPSTETGLLIVRGHFATSLYASLSRSQTDFGGPSTFGLEVTRYPYAYNFFGKTIGQTQLEEQVKKTSKDKDREGVKNGSSFALGQMIDRGCFNYRYPVTEYYLELHPFQEAIELAKKDKPPANTLPPITEDAEDSASSEIGGDGSPQPVQNSPPPPGVLSGGSNNLTDPSQHTPNASPDQAVPPVDNAVDTLPQASITPVGETANTEKADDKDNESGPQGKVVGTCQMFSCAMDKQFYQILRIEESRPSDNNDFDMSFPKDSQIVLTMGGPVWFQSFNDGEHDLVLGVGTRMPSSLQQRKNSKEEEEDEEDNGKPEEPVIDIHEHEESTQTMAYWVKNEDKEGATVPTKMGRGLRCQVYEYDDYGGYEKLDLIKSTWEADNGPDKTGLTAYNIVRRLKPELPTPKNKNKQPRSATFVAVIRLYEGDKEGLIGWEETPPPPHKFYEHIGVDHLDKNATSAMWERIFLDPHARGAGLEPVLNLAEFNMIGRSLEKILQVDMIPATFKDDSSHEADPNDIYHQSKYLALVSNLFVKANVDLKAMFWKIRFLIRVHRYLSYIHRLATDTAEEETDNTEGANNQTQPQQSEEVQQTAILQAAQQQPPQSEEVQRTDPVEEAQKKCIEHQIGRIRTAVESAVRYLAKALLEPPLIGKTNTPMMPDHKVPGESNYYYVMTTIWYVLRYFQETDPKWKFNWVKSLGTKGISSILLTPRRLPPDEWTFAASDSDKVQLLQWFHYGSLLKLWEKGVLNDSWNRAGRDLEYKVRRLANAAKMASSAKLSSREPYVADDEIFDRLSFVSDELGLEGLGPTDNGVVATLSMKRVKGREYTRTLNPGWLPKNKEGSTSGPWEIHALCHHSRLVVLTKEEKTENSFRTREHTHSEAEGFRQNICNFLNAEGTLIPCWERAHAKYRKGWLRSEATPVVATTLVIILEKIAELSAQDALAEKSTSSGNDSSTKPPAGQAKLEWPQTIATYAKRANDHEQRIIQEVVHLGGLMKGQLDAFERFTNESGQKPPIVWKSFRPPITYHPTSFTDSLEDKPDLYKYQVLSKLSMPLSLTQDVIDCPETVAEAERDFERNDIDKIFDNPEIRDLLFICDIKAARNEDKNNGFTWVIKDYHCKKDIGALEWALYDSLVDQEVQHRFHTVKPLRKEETPTPVKIPKEILELVVYVIHPEAAACLGDHIRDILNFSRFSCQTGDTWVASITLRSWRVHDKYKFQRPPGDAPIDPEKKNSADDFYLPTNLMQVWKDMKGLNENTMFKPEVASIILSTNSFGDFSKCTLVAEFITPNKLKKLATKAREVWQKFIHQPQTARCLVFFLLLGNMCEELTVQYTTSIGKLADLLVLDGTFTKTVDDYPQKYELGVWSLDALYKLQSSLNATVYSLLKAKQELTAQIIAGPGQRSIQLERMCQDYLSKFEDDLVQLTAVNVELNRRIELHTRNKDATSAILTMRDSRTAISQNSTVQRLTYLTIGYLPIALMAAIFAIPGTTNVLYPAMANRGRSWFIGSIIIIAFLTWTLAIYIGAILKFLQDFFRYPPPMPGQDKSKKKNVNKPPLNLWREAGRGGKWMWDNWVAGAWRKDEKPRDVKQTEKKERKRRFSWVIDNWFVSDWLEEGDGKKKEKEKKGGFKWIGDRWSKTEGEPKEKEPKTSTNPEKAAEEGRGGNGEGSSTEASEPLVTNLEVSETEVPATEPGTADAGT